MSGLCVLWSSGTWVFTLVELMACPVSRLPSPGILNLKRMARGNTFQKRKYFSLLKRTLSFFALGIAYFLWGRYMCVCPGFLSIVLCIKETVQLNKIVVLWFCLIKRRMVTVTISQDWLQAAPCGCGLRVLSALGPLCAGLFTKTLGN